MATALYFKPSWERQQTLIQSIAPDLRVGVYDEDGRILLDGKEISLEELQPEYFWIHGELFFSPRLRDYFKLMLECPTIKWLHTVNTGLDKLPYLELVEKGVMVTNNHAQAIAIAEYTFGQLLAYYQDVFDFKDKQAEGVWKHRGFREIAGTHWTIIGFGHIGQEIARRAKAFGATVTAVRRNQQTEGLADNVCATADMSDVLPQSDVIVLACASNNATRNMVDKDFLNQMKQDAVLINIARGDLIVERDLHVALDDVRPAYAILDVFNEEPPHANSWVWNHPRVSLTPHTSNAGSGMRGRSLANFLDNLQRMESGLPLQNQVSKKDIV